ncbi:YqgE/AlgH family protein [Planktotalea sp.]|uniref:YqgE/AlgH family protein n=1 Tax=Planktotalea sp. TaxID=2029877 RepID=UPI0025F78CAF|nr:YqgE/AlgH family protein [Planktotalea sp.]
MKIKVPNLGLSGKCLISMPDMPDSRFRSSVIFLCAHSDEGAMGIIVNKPAQDVKLTDLMDQLSIPKDTCDKDWPVYFGGPVEHGRGFVLHTSEYRSELSTMDAGPNLAMTATIDILEDIGAEKGPQSALIALGYAGWGPGQLEQEIAVNGWLVADVGADIIFRTPDNEKWAAALGTLGVDPAILSSSGGRA